MKITEIYKTKKFKKDYKICKKRNKNLQKLEKIITELVFEGELDSKHYPHKLKGNYTGYWECHIEPDWLLIYEISGDLLNLIRTGTHSDLFD